MTVLATVLALIILRISVTESPRIAAACSTANIVESGRSLKGSLAMRLRTRASSRRVVSYEPTCGHNAPHTLHSWGIPVGVTGADAVDGAERAQAINCILNHAKREKRTATHTNRPYHRDIAYVYSVNSRNLTTNGCASLGEKSPGRAA